MPVGLNENPVGLVDPACPLDWSHPLNRGLVSRWKVIPNSGWRGGLTFRDLARGGKKPNDGTLVNGPTWVSSGRRGGNGAIYFAPGTTNSVTVSSLSSKIPGSYTVSAWFTETIWTSEQQILSAYSAPSDEVGMSVISSNVVRSYTSASGTSNNLVDGTTTLVSNTWYHYVLRIDTVALTKTLFLNGKVEAGPLGTTAPVTWNNATVYLGNISANGRDLFGKLDDICIHNRALSASEVSQLYQEQLRGSPETLRWVGARTYGFSEQAAATGGTPIFSSGILSSRIIGGGGIAA
jgi:hypothetical protein